MSIFRLSLVLFIDVENSIFILNKGIIHLAIFNSTFSS